MAAPIVERNVFPKETHSQIIDYLDEQVPFLNYGLDTDNFTRRYIHNPAFFVHIHGQLVEYVSELCNEKLIPSYSFLSMYDENGICPLHLDRPQCYRTFDYLIRQSPDEPWPIYVGDPMTEEQRADIDPSPETPAGIKKVKLNTNWNQVDLMPNDGVIYSGTHSWHYRDRLPTGTADLVFFHFVPEGFNDDLN